MIQYYLIFFQFIWKVLFYENMATVNTILLVSKIIELLKQSFMLDQILPSWFIFLAGIKKSCVCVCRVFRNDFTNFITEVVHLCAQNMQ